MIFLTVGTLLPFDRLVKAVDEAVRDGYIKDEVFAQIGNGKYKPRYMKYLEILQKEHYDSYFESASAIISHAGMGTISMALDRRKPLLVMPRLKRYKEIVSDHQLPTANKLSDLGHVLLAGDTDELPVKLRELSGFVPKKRNTQARQVAERIALFLEHFV